MRSQGKLLSSRLERQTQTITSHWSRNPGYESLTGNLTTQWRLRVDSSAGEKLQEASATSWEGPKTPVRQFPRAPPYPHRAYQRKSPSCFQKKVGKTAILTYAKTLGSSYQGENISQESHLPGGPPWWLSSKESTCQCRRHRLDPWVWKIPWRRDWQPAPVFLPGKSHGQRSLVGYTVHGVTKRVGHDLGTQQEQQTCQRKRNTQLQPTPAPCPT